MSQHRQAQWTNRLRQLQALRERLTAAGRYDRAYKAHLIAQHGYARWAHEVFATTRPQRAEPARPAVEPHEEAAA